MGFLMTPCDGKILLIPSRYNGLVKGGVKLGHCGGVKVGQWIVE
jgi:hypothetical protein